MRQKSGTPKPSAEQVAKDIRRRTRKHHLTEEEFRIVLEGLRGEASIAELCRREGFAQNLYYSWSKEFLEPCKRRMAGDMARQAIIALPPNPRPPGAGKSGLSHDGEPDAPARPSRAPPASYQPLVRFTIRTTDSITGTSIRTPTTVASAAPESKPKRLIAAATASSKKFEAPMSAEGPATQCASPVARLSR